MSENEDRAARQEGVCLFHWSRQKMPVTLESENHHFAAIITQTGWGPHHWWMRDPGRNVDGRPNGLQESPSDHCSVAVEKSSHTRKRNQACLYQVIKTNTANAGQMGIVRLQTWSCWECVTWIYPSGDPDEPQMRDMLFLKNNKKEETVFF